VARQQAKGSTGLAAAIDVDTTGLDPEREEIIELAISVFRFDRAKGHFLETISEYSGFREPSCRIPREVSQIHGITRRAVKGLDLDYRRRA
jgi:DNA polymerase-3 subunit epsilon